MRPSCASHGLYARARRAHAHYGGREKEGERPLLEAAAPTTPNYPHVACVTTWFSWYSYSSYHRNLHLAIWHAPTSLAMKSAQPRAQRKRHWARQVRRGQPSVERACFGVGSLGTTCERGAGGHAKREGEPGGGLSSYKIDTLSGCFLVHVLRQIQTCRSAPFWIQSRMHKSGRRLSVCT